VDLVVRHGLAGHITRGRRALLDRVLPMLHANTPLEHRVIVIGDVARGKDPLDARAAVLIDDDAVVDGNAAAVEKVHGWLDANPGNDEIAFQTYSCFGNNGGNTLRSFEGGDRVLENRPNAVRTMEFGHGIPNRLAEYTEERCP
jgi:hypothetical protein